MRDGAIPELGRPFIRLDCPRLRIHATLMSGSWLPWSSPELTSCSV